jgi:hypothetical protein
LISCGDYSNRVRRLFEGLAALPLLAIDVGMEGWLAKSAES